jgi:hypothetical protein
MDSLLDPDLLLPKAHFLILMTFTEETRQAVGALWIERSGTITREFLERERLLAEYIRSEVERGHSADW